MEHGKIKHLTIHVENYIVPCELFDNTVYFYDSEIPTLKMQTQPTREDIRKHLLKYRNKLNKGK